MSNARRHVLAAAAMLAIASFAACTGGDDAGDAGDATATATAPTASASATPSPPTATPDTNGVIDRIVAAVLARDEPALTSLLRLTSVPCVQTPPDGGGAPPVCRDGEQDGATVDVLPSAQCEGFFSRRDELLVNRWPLAGSALYAAYPAPEGFFPPGQYVIIFERGPGMSAGLAWELIASGEGIVGVNFGCGQTPDQIVALQRLANPIVPSP